MKFITIITELAETLSISYAFGLLLVLFLHIMLVICYWICLDNCSRSYIQKWILWTSVFAALVCEFFGVISFYKWYAGAFWWRIICFEFWWEGISSFPVFSWSCKINLSSNGIASRVACVSRLCVFCQGVQEWIDHLVIGVKEEHSWYPFLLIMKYSRQGVSNWLWMVFWTSGRLSNW